MRARSTLYWSQSNNFSCSNHYYIHAMLIEVCVQGDQIAVVCRQLRFISF